MREEAVRTVASPLDNHHVYPFGDARLDEARSLGVSLRASRRRVAGTA
jgi:hypothetical protein